MSPVTTSIASETGDIQISWLKPHTGYETILGYLIEIQTSELEWIDSECPSQAFNCTIEMQKLLFAPYNLAFDSILRVRATASNAYGSALLPSEVN
jgi:hypothetical protein